MLGRERFTGAEAEVVASSSEFSSGTARFLPLASFAGSLIVSADAGGYVERRALLFALAVLSTASLSFPLPPVDSRARLLDDELDADGCSARSFSFSFAALTRALERSTLVSRLVVGVELDGSPRCGVASFWWVESI